jgi:hypothetical protein
MMHITDDIIRPYKQRSNPSSRQLSGSKHPRSEEGDKQHQPRKTKMTRQQRRRMKEVKKGIISTDTDESNPSLDGAPKAVA